jgi:hypothetical protein
VSRRQACAPSLFLPCYLRDSFRTRRPHGRSRLGFGRGRCPSGEHELPPFFFLATCGRGMDPLHRWLQCPPPAWIRFVNGRGVLPRPRRVDPAANTLVSLHGVVAAQAGVGGGSRAGGPPPQQDRGSRPLTSASVSFATTHQQIEPPHLRPALSAGRRLPLLPSTTASPSVSRWRQALLPSVKAPACRFF